MEDVDVIFLSHTRDLTYYGMTQRAINSLQSSEKDYSFDIKLIESNKQAISEKMLYADCKVIVPPEKFSYNKFLNYGLAACKHSWLVVCNNDIVFMEGWFSAIMEQHQKNPSLKSFSPFEPNWHTALGFDSGSTELYYGYRTSCEIAGWCLVVHRDILENCALFDPQFSFIYQDNDYAETIKNSGYEHALVCKSTVYHVTSQSDGLIMDEDREHMFDEQKRIFYKKWPNAISAQ